MSEIISVHVTLSGSPASAVMMYPATSPMIADQKSATISFIFTLLSVKIYPKFIIVQIGKNYKFLRGNLFLGRFFKKNKHSSDFFKKRLIKKDFLIKNFLFLSNF